MADRDAVVLVVCEHGPRALEAVRTLRAQGGDGRDFRHYPGTVEQVVAIEPEPYLRPRARQHAADASNQGRGSRR